MPAHRGDPPGISQRAIFYGCLFSIPFWLAIILAITLILRLT